MRSLREAGSSGDRMTMEGIMPLLGSGCSQFTAITEPGCAACRAGAGETGGSSPAGGGGMGTAGARAAVQVQISRISVGMDRFIFTGSVPGGGQVSVRPGSREAGHRHRTVAAPWNTPRKSATLLVALLRGSTLLPAAHDPEGDAVPGTGERAEETGTSLECMAGWPE